MNNKNKTYEINETCPHCNHENTWEVSLEELNKPIRTCQNCGRQIFVCSECEECQCSHCDWHRTYDGGSACCRGTIAPDPKHMGCVNIYSEMNPWMDLCVICDDEDVDVIAACCTEGFDNFYANDDSRGYVEEVRLCCLDSHKFFEIIVDDSYDPDRDGDHPSEAYTERVNGFREIYGERFADILY